MDYTVLDLAQMLVEALFVHDADDKLLRINEPDPSNPAPRFFLIRTQEGNLWRIRYDLPEDLTSKLNQLASNEPVVSDLRQPPYHQQAYAQLLQQHAPIQSITAGPAYCLPELDPPRGTVTITAQNAALLQTYFPYLLSYLDVYAPIEVVVVDGTAVAACFSSRLTQRVGAAGVYTEAAYRGRGYALEIVRGWAAGTREAGRLPLYDTSWSNTASQAVAKKLRAVQYAVNFSIT